MALTRGRVVFELGGFGRDVSACLQSILTLPSEASKLSLMANLARQRRGVSGEPGNLKTGVGGMSDIEILTQCLQLQHSSECPKLLCSNTWEALSALRRASRISKQEFALLSGAYTFYRTVESRLRILQNQSEVTLPVRSDALQQLARRFDARTGAASNPTELFRARLARHQKQVSDIFNRRVRMPQQGRHGFE
jgi:glutamate-ammonia-ligase adenylyltransferase